MDPCNHPDTMFQGIRINNIMKVLDGSKKKFMPESRIKQYLKTEDMIN